MAEAAVLSKHGYIAKKRAGMLEREHRRQLEENKRRLDSYFIEFDTDKTGTLDPEDGGGGSGFGSLEATT